MTPTPPNTPPYPDGVGGHKLVHHQLLALDVHVVGGAQVQPVVGLHLLYTKLTGYLVGENCMGSESVILQ